MLLLIWISKFIGFGGTLMLIVFTGIIGASLARAQGLGVLRQVQQGMASGNAPAATLVEGFLVLIGGIVLLTPGILTDVFGFSMMVPQFRRAFAKFLSHRFKHHIASRTQSSFSFHASPFGPEKPASKKKPDSDDDFIDV